MKPVISTLLAFAALALAAIAAAQGRAPAKPPEKPLTPEALAAEIEGMRVARVAWRGIVWKSCLVDGLREAKAKGKPVLLWIFIDRPADDARC